MQRTLRSSVAWLTLPALSAVALPGLGCSSQPAAGHASLDADAPRQLRAHVALDDASWAASRQARLGVTATGAAASLGASSGPVAGGYAAYARLHDADDAATPAAFAEVPTH